MSLDSQTGQGEVTVMMSDADRIDILCDDFELAYIRGQNPRFEDYLAQYEGLQRAELFAELMLVDMELRRNRGENLTRDEYLTRFPHYAEVIETVAFKQGLASTGQNENSTAMGEVSLVGRFRLEERLGAGTNGEVWRAQDARLQRAVAVKIPRSSHLDEQQLHRFLREARAAAQLQHACIVPVHEAGRDGDRAFIVSDLIEGEDLRAWMAERRIEPRRAAELCAKLADALHHAHEKGVIHRDLKPANILMDRAENPHITDFGLAKWSADTQLMTLEGHPFGTPAYMSPEQARGDAARVDRRTDVYSLGAILYEMLSGARPFSGEQTELLRAVIQDDPRPPRAIRREVPRDLETICLKALRKEPGRRYATAQEMAVDLQRFLRGDPIFARRASLGEKTWRKIRKHPAMTTAAVLATVALAAIAVATLLVQENRVLLGLKPVRLETVPSGARVAFVPLHETTQEPLADQVVYPKMRSPVDVELRPGNYLVVAALDDGRFHEVYRRVPKDPKSGSFPYNHEKWSVTDGVVLLPEIEIPFLSVTNGMALVDAATNADQRDGADSRSPLAFYMDTREFTVSDYLRNPWEERISMSDYIRKFRESRPSLKDDKNLKADDYAISVRFDEAVYLAERSGKRLPTPEEFERAAALGDPLACAKETPPKDFGPVGTPECDRVGSNPAIAGLYSNVAEWTMNIIQIPADVNVPVKPDFPFLASGGIVKGGDLMVIEGDPILAPEHRRPSSFMKIYRLEKKSGVGFRCVRSVRPRFLSEE